MCEGLWNSFPWFRPSLSPPHRVMVSLGGEKEFFTLALTLIFLKGVGVTVELIFYFDLGSGGRGSPNQSNLPLSCL